MSIYHVSISLLHLYHVVGLKPALLLVSQPLILFISRKVFKHAWAVWTIALSIIMLENYRSETMRMMDEELDYIFHQILIWVNLRCVSYCLDNIWGDVEENPSTIWNFLEMLSYCFYLPVCISGPLINFQEYKKGVKIFGMKFDQGCNCTKIYLFYF